ncbi:response regulator [Nitrospirota bacterium]
MSRIALIIDNDENTVSQANAALSPLGYSVSSASDATAGLEMANNLVPSIMLVNLATPGSNGLELCKTIHGTEGLKDVPIILLTLREGKFDPVYVKLYGIVAFLKKPFNDDTLTSLVNENSTATEEPVVEALEEPVVEALEEPVVEALEEPVVEALEEPVVEALEEPVVEAFEEPVVEALEEPAAEAFEETAYTEPIAEVDTFSAEVDSFEGADATTTMSVGDEGDEAMAFESPETEGEFGETVTLSDAESDLGALQDSFSSGDYAEEETAAIDESAETADNSFDFSSAPETGAAEEDGDDSDSSWGDMSSSMTMDDSASTDQADETWGGMGGDLSMTDAMGESAGEWETSQTDVFAAAEQEDTGGFDSDGTMAFDAGGESDTGAAETAGGDFDAGGGFDSDGTMAFDSAQDTSPDSGESGDLDIGGFQASKEASPSVDTGFGMDDGADESAWGDTAVESAPSAEQPEAKFEEEEEAFSAGFEEDEDAAADEFPDTEGFGEDDAAAFEGEEAGFKSDFLEDSEESSSDFAGDDQDYTGLFDAVEEEKPEEVKKGKKKKKKGFKKSASSKTRKVLVLVLLLVIAGGGAFYFRDMLPFEIPDISFKMPDIKIPFIGKDASDEPAQPARRPEPKTDPGKPVPAKEPVRPEAKKPEPSKPTPDVPQKAVTKAPEKPAMKEPVAPKAEVAKKTTPKKAKKPAPSKTSTGTFKKGFYYVQFGVFGNTRNADILSGQLNKKGFPTLKRKITNSKGRKLTVILLDRPYKSRGSAEKRAKAISDKTGFDTAVFR